MKREIRYQAAIIKDNHILLIRHQECATGRSYWLLPGGGREPDETEEACVQREAQEETGLEVSVERLLLDEEDIPFEMYYRRLKTYLCRVINGDPQPGHDPEVESAQQHSIAEVRWFGLGASVQWDDSITDDALICPLLQRIRAVLGHL
ncbi:MAG: NUDIX domain-containing protein [Dehalococcoidia bacterium]